MRDLVIIGGGPGGYVAAIRASQLGMRPLLIEKERLGGTCLNRGCIPTKTYYQSAKVLRTLQRADEFGVESGPVGFNMQAAFSRKEQVVEQLVKGIKGLLDANKVEVLEGEAKLVAPGLVEVAGQEVQAERILIATGSVSSAPPIAGRDLPGVLDSDAILALEEVPERLAVIGGGVIGLEFASIFQSFGSQVTVLEYLPHLLTEVDKEIGKRLSIFLRRQGIGINMGARVESIEQADGALVVRAMVNAGEESYAADKVLLATGRRPQVAGLNLEGLGVATNRGFLVVDENYETNVPGIYAIGDVIGGAMLAHVASDEGIVAVERMQGLASRVAYHAIPAVVFTQPELGTVGLSEEAAKAAGVSYKVGKFSFGANSKAVAMGETEGLVKVLTDEDEVIIGAHILGPHAADLIQIATVAVTERLTVDQVAATIHPHPTLSEAWLEAVLDTRREAIHSRPRP